MKRPDGKIWRGIYLPDGGQICCVSSGKEQSIFENNHSVYRLDKNGEVIWQIKRNEGEWVLYEKSRKKNEARNAPDEFGRWQSSPFMELWLQYADGSTNANPMPCDHTFPHFAIWVEGAKIMAGTLDSHNYEIDIETGIAKNYKPYVLRREW
jgi:hypothetical protein